MLLAKDPIGTRHLYYSFDDSQVSWSTILDPLVRLVDKPFTLNEEYIAGWLSMLSGRAFNALCRSSFRATLLIRASRTRKTSSQQVLGFRPG